MAYSAMRTTKKRGRRCHCRKRQTPVHTTPRKTMITTVDSGRTEGEEEGKKVEDVEEKNKKKALFCAESER